MSEEKKPTLDLGSMMDETLDNIQEAPDFNNPPAGDYRLRCKEAKIDKYTPKGETQESQRLKVFYSVVTTYKLADEKEPPVPDESLFSETFQANEDGLGYFKKRIREIMGVSNIDGVSLRDMITSVAGQEFDARITIRKTTDKTDKNKVYENINMRVIPPRAEGDSAS